VHEARAAVGHFEFPGVGAGGAGERAALVAEELRHGEALGHRAAVPADERLGVEVAQPVDLARRKFFPRPALAQDQHGGVGGGHSGKFEVADGGTLFMDEVTDLPLTVQASLLRVLQEKEIVRVGGEKTIGVNVRLVAASNKDFKELIPAGRFRLDLYYRLSTVVLRMPPLRER